MKIAVPSLADRPTTLDATLAPGELDLIAEHTVFEHGVQVSVTVTRMQEDVLANGRASTVATAECSRCLDPVPVELRGEFEALFVPETGAYGQRMGRRDFEWGDQRVNFYTEMTVDLTEEIRQCLLLELPMKPLCRTDCKGLCPQCGHNRNEGPCSCRTEEPEDPWEKLRSLLPPRRP
ncbi:MAG TPA: DUF177 domain-containing protein [Planctomycetota bacterium]|nr:DUF177 domain-containing protein [Planctomycetota bacterium]HRR79355.1 DUF177 domain-containing protein [Planctomycetota bacterium]